MSENLASRAALNPGEVAKSLYLQELERATDLRPFLAEMERVMKSSSSDSDDDESSSDSDNKVKRNVQRSKGDRLVNGILMTREDRRKDRARFYNFSNVGKEREWLKEVLLNSSESSEDETTPEGKDRRIRTILKHRRLELKYAKRFQMKKTLIKKPGKRSCYACNNIARRLSINAAVMFSVDAYEFTRIHGCISKKPSTSDEEDAPSQDKQTSDKDAAKMVVENDDNQNVVDQTMELVGKVEAMKLDEK